MKKTMRISGLAGTILLSFATLFRVMHWPGASVLLVAGAVTLAFVFIPSAFVVIRKETRSSKRLLLFIPGFLTVMLFIMGILLRIQHWPGSGILLILAAGTAIFLFIPSLLYRLLKDPENRSKRAVYIPGAIGIMLFITGFLFKVMHWPLSEFLIMSGLLILFIVVFPWYTYLTWKNEKFIRREFIYLVVGSIAIIIPAALISVNVQLSYDEGYYVNQKQEQVMYDYLKENNQAFLDQNKTAPNLRMMELVHSITADVIAQINSVETLMIALSEGEPGKPAEMPLEQILQTEKGPVIRYELITNPFDPEPVKKFLLPGTSSRAIIETAVSDYMRFLSGLMPPEKVDEIAGMIDPSNCLPVQIEEGKDISMISGLHSLALMKNRLLTAEFQALQNIAQKQ